MRKVQKIYALLKVGGQFCVGAFTLLEFFTGQFQVLRVFTHGLLGLALLYRELTEL